MNTLQKIEKMAAKLGKLHNFADAHLAAFDTVCIHGIDADDKPPSVCLYDKPQAIATFGASGWVRADSDPGWFNWRKEIDGVRVDIFKCEERERQIIFFRPVPEWLALGQPEPETAQ